MNDIMHENLRKFLLYLEAKKVINFSEIEHDNMKMKRLIEEISQFDFSNFNDPNFMAEGH